MRIVNLSRSKSIHRAHRRPTHDDGYGISGRAGCLYVPAMALDRNLESIYQRVSPSVVFIKVVQKTGSGSTTQSSGNNPTVVSGSGFVWDSQGDIVTNNHVVENAGTIQVTFLDGTEADARIVGTDPGSDLAVIRVSADPKLLKPVTLGDSDAVKVGETAIVIGYPFGLDSTMTSGIVSGLSRLLPVSSSGGSGPSYSIPGVIQTDAPINPGNSGGVLLNDRGEVIGVPSANISTSGSSAGVGFAIPSNIVRMEVPVLISSGGISARVPRYQRRDSHVGSGPGDGIGSEHARSASRRRSIRRSGG